MVVCMSTVIVFNAPPILYIACMYRPLDFDTLLYNQLLGQLHGNHYRKVYCTPAVP